jgi:multidrug efflux pump subunit AcrB
MKISKKSNRKDGQAKLLSSLSLAAFKRPRVVAVLWICLILFGLLSYTTLLKREGFPGINTPFAISTGSYLVHDPAKVDRDVTKPLSDYLLKQDGVKTVISQSYSDFYNVIVNYKDGVNAEDRSKQLSQAVQDKHILPAQATLKIEPYKFGFTPQGDKMVVAFYAPGNNADTASLLKKAEQAATYLKDQHIALVTDVHAISPLENVADPSTGQIVANQKSFDRYGERNNSAASFYKSIVIGVQAPDGTDNLKLDEGVQKAVAELNKQSEFSGYRATVSASFAPQIKDQIHTLQTALLEGLAAVLIVGSIVIAIRASLVTVLSMATVITIVLGLLFLVGYTLNTITLFALILGLSLIVDDTIIMVEAIDKQRQRQKTAEAAVEQATSKVSRAMIAATSTSVLSFAPLLFVGGILGSFIRAIPVTIMAALIISLLVALIFIPMFARYLLLGKKQMGKSNVKEVAAGVEAAIARFISGPMLWAKGSTKKLFLVGITAVVIGFGFIAAGGWLFQKVTFNIFPNSKDSDQLTTVITYQPNTDIEQAQSIADEVDKNVAQTIGVNFKQASYYGMADIQSATLTIDVTGYQTRDVTAPELAKQINANFKDYGKAKVEAAILDVAGPPAAAFNVQIKSDQNRPGALKLAEDIASYMQHEAVLKRPDGTTAKVKDVSVGNSSIYYRKDAVGYVTVGVKFVDDDTTTLVTLAKDSVKKEFPPSKVASYGLPKDALQYDTGQEQENQDSFKTLALAFPLLLLAIYFLLAFQFRSLLQPLLIFTALPFSIFGITLGLWLTNNAFGFFTMLGFFALIGLSIKNTILLTDYANQQRKAGLGVVDSIHEALAERFRPLIATSLTAVFSLIPLTLSSPFWEGLGVTLIFGLLSSTFLVITVFPYYYLGAEFLRQRVSRRAALVWLVATIGLTVALGIKFLLPIALGIIVLEKVYGRRRRAA